MKPAWTLGPAFAALLLAGCQTASLEDAAPKAVPAATDTSATDPSASGNTAATATGVRKNPGIVSPVPLEGPADVRSKDFVSEGARRTGVYPGFGNTPQAANSQMSQAEKIAAEAQMTELLRARATTPNARALYEARLRRLRALADSHAQQAQDEIEN